MFSVDADDTGIMMSVFKFVTYGVTCSLDDSKMELDDIT